MDHGVDPHNRAAADMAGVKDRGPGSDEDLVLDAGADDVGARADQAVIADRGRMPRGRPQDRVLHDDARSADLDRATLGDHLGTVHDPRPRADRHIATERGGRRDPGLGVNLGGFSIMLEQHRQVPSTVSSARARVPTGQSSPAQRSWAQSRQVARA